MPDHNLKPQDRVVYFVSDGTGITAETLAHSLLSQFESLEIKEVRVPFIDTADKAIALCARIKNAHVTTGVRPVVFSTLVNETISVPLRDSGAMVIDLFQSFIAPLEQEFGTKSTHAVGRSHGAMDKKEYRDRIEAINFTLAHDDGVSDKDLRDADVILIGVSRSGKTPTSLYLAMQFGIKAANYPLIPEDFERDAFPSAILTHRSKVFGLTIDPNRLSEIRHERRPNSTYAKLENCRYEVASAEKMMLREKVQWLSTTTKSIEEIAASILQAIHIDKRGF